jgi:hypothetical protein
MAAAATGQVASIVTWNARDIESTFLSRHGVAVADPDVYLNRLLDEVPEEVLTAIRRIAAGKRRPPMRPADIMDALAKAGVPVFAQAARQRLDERTE